MSIPGKTFNIQSGLEHHHRRFLYSITIQTTVNTLNLNTEGNKFLEIFNFYLLSSNL